MLHNDTYQIYFHINIFSWPKLASVHGNPTLVSWVHVVCWLKQKQRGNDANFENLSWKNKSSMVIKSIKNAGENSNNNLIQQYTFRFIVFRLCKRNPLKFNQNFVKMFTGRNLYSENSWKQKYFTLIVYKPVSNQILPSFWSTYFPRISVSMIKIFKE